MSDYRKYTEEGDRVILSEITETPYNLMGAFRRASIQINRSPEAISFHWYHSLRKKTGCVFMTVSGRRCTVNGKNVVLLDNSNTTIIDNSLWNRIKRFLRL